MSHGLNFPPEADALQWAITQLGDTNPKTEEPWTQEERNYIHELRELKQRYSNGVPYNRPA